MKDKFGIELDIWFYRMTGLTANSTGNIDGSKCPTRTPVISFK